jgi:dihydrofolate reductase
VVFNHLSLDGVMQAPGGPGEDRRGGFQHGGWAAADNDPVMDEVIAGGMSEGGALLLGRWTYESMYAFWPNQTDRGSGVLVQSLMRRNLIDEYQLLIHPIVLGSGRRLFSDGVFAALRLVDSVTTTTGVLIARYRPADASAGGRNNG